jgi:hypothetical protein
MAYSTSIPPALLVGRIGGAPAIWSYRSADAVGDVDASGYFTNGKALGMTLGDVVFVYDTATPLVTTCWVSAVNATTGVATVTQHA